MPDSSSGNTVCKEKIMLMSNRVFWGLVFFFQSSSLHNFQREFKELRSVSNLVSFCFDFIPTNLTPDLIETPNVSHSCY